MRIARLSVRRGFMARVFGLSAMAGSAVALAQTGVTASLQTSVPFNISYGLSPLPVDLVIAPATRTVSNVDVAYTVYDLYKNAVGQGSFNLPLVNGVEARRSFTFTPPGNGWYTVEAQVSSGGQRIAGKGLHFGVTPHYATTPDMAADSFSGWWNDEARSAFSGMRLDRTNTNGGAAQVALVQQEANQYGMNLIVQFEGQTQSQPAYVSNMVNQLKGTVKYWEVWNEPNFAITPQAYVDLLKQDYPIIKSIDPAAKVLGPAVCGVDLNWYRQFYDAGGGQYCDIVSVHDYEGNEAIDPGHWRWKFGELKNIMTEHGDGAKEIWQTERAIGGVRAKLFLGGVQAVRTGLQRDLLASMGIPNEHNYHYYINQVGYSDVPTYAWSGTGPHPMALSLRTRDAMTQGRTLAETLDFGATGNKIFLGLRYTGADGQTLVLRNLGTLDKPVTLNVQGGSSVTVVDAFGNQSTLPVVNGKVSVNTSAMGVYVRVGAGQQISAQPINFGQNIASQATFTFSGATTSNNAILTNGIFEAAHPSDPNGTYWQGQMAGSPQSLTMTFATPRQIDKAIFFSVRADNPYCALLDYDLQYWNGAGWVTIEQVRTPCGQTDVVDTADAGANTWYMDQNFFVNEFAPVTTDRLRLVALRVTNGFQPDDIASGVTGWYANSDAPLMLREVEIYAVVPEPSALFLFILAPLIMRRPVDSASL